MNTTKLIHIDATPAQWRSYGFRGRFFIRLFTLTGLLTYEVLESEFEGEYMNDPCWSGSTVIDKPGAATDFLNKI